MLLHPVEANEIDLRGKALSVLDEVRKAVIGKDEVVSKVLMTILARGHVLLEDVPGVGKTNLALAFSRAMALDYKRIQFTPEVMPADVVGFSIYNKETGQLAYQPGAAFCNLFLVDEINRASSKTQSALLEAMEEGRVTLDGFTREIPKPYTVIATQNPMGSAGTQLLPESQVDRFMVRLSIGYPAPGDEANILKRSQGRELLQEVRQTVNATDILRMQEEAEAVYMNDDIRDYIVRLAVATRNHALIRLGVSPRASIALARLSQSIAWLSGRDYVIPPDVISVLPDVFGHRLSLNPQVGIGGETVAELLADIMKDVPPPKIAREKTAPRQ